LIRNRANGAAIPAPVYALGAIASVQIGATVARRLFEYLGPAGTVFVRVGFGALILLAIAWPRRLRTVTGHWRSVVLFGLIIAGMNLCFYESIARIPLGIAVTIEFLGPLGVAVAGSRKVLDFVWVAMAATGVALLSLTGGQATLVGVLFALGAAVGWACYILINQRVGRVVPGASGLAFALAIGAVALAPFGLVGAGAHLLNFRNLGVGLVVAILSTAIPFSLEFAALRRLSSQVFGILMSLEPAVGAAAGFVLLGQRLSIRDLFAILLVIAASAGATLAAPRASTIQDVP
jgi:inner membrane transporter RhtA